MKNDNDDMESKLKYYMFVYQKTDSFRQHINYRASLVVAVCAILITCTSSMLNLFMSPTSPVYDIFLFSMATLFFGLAFLSVLYGMYSIHPHFFRNRKDRKGSKMNPTTSAFTYIVRMSRKDFKEQCIGKDSLGLLEDALDGIYNLSVILNGRYDNLRRAYVSLFFTVSVFIILVIYSFAILFSRGVIN